MSTTHAHTHTPCPVRAPYIEAGGGSAVWIWMHSPASASLVWSSYRKALWNTTVGLRVFWRSLVALPLPLQSYCQGNSERAACHLVHYHTAMVSWSEEVWYLVSWKCSASLSPLAKTLPSVLSGTLTLLQCKLVQGLLQNTLLFITSVKKLTAAPHIYEF